MYDTLDHDFQIILPYLSSVLVAPDVVLQLQALAQSLPSFTYAGLECRLGADQPQVDLQVCFPPSVPAIPAEFLTHPVWQTVIGMLSDWVQPHSDLHQIVKNIWWEFDIVNTANLIPLPSLFFTLSAQQSEPINSTFRAIQAILEALNLLGSEELDSTLSQCCSMVPPGAAISHVGVMLARPTQTVRLNVRGLSAPDIVDYWHLIGGMPIPGLAALVSTLSSMVDAMVFTVDVKDCLTPNVGIECFFSKQPPTEPRWRSLLDYLVTQGLCASGKRDALLAWPGLIQQRPSIAHECNSFSGDVCLLGSRANQVVWRSLNHLKLAVGPQGCVAAKGYLALGHRWIDQHKRH